jgi:hypothetical protein
MKMRARRASIGKGWIWSWVFLLWVSSAFAAEPMTPALPLWSFEQGIVNEWAGRYNTYQREPSWARTYLDPQVTRSNKGHSLRVTVHQEATGFCGIWMDLAGEAGSSKAFHDATFYPYLSFWIKGERGGEDFEMSLTDASMGEGAEPKTNLHLHDYLPQGVTTQWQEVLIPIGAFAGTDARRLVRLILHFTAPGDYRFYLDDIALKQQKSARLIPTAPAPEAAAGAPSSDRHRAMWVWRTLQIFKGDPQGDVDRLFAFCSANGIREIYLAVEFDEKKAEGGPVFNVRQPEDYKSLLERAHGQGFLAEALAGTPEWALSKNHAGALAALDAVLAFNRAAPPAARFDGVHFDVEPYVLIDYADPTCRPAILQQFLEMVLRCLERVGGESKLRFSCDVPSWYYPAGAERQGLLVNFHGQEKTVGEHLTDMLDAVTIMDYVNQADGAGGIIARGMPAVEYASSQGKKIRVGLETFLEPPSVVYFIGHIPAQEYRDRLASSGISGNLFFEGFRLAVISDPASFHVGLGQPADMPDSRRAEFQTALLHLARKLNEGASAQDAPHASDFEAVRAVLARDPEWSGFETFEISDPDSNRALPSFHAVRRMLPRTTFHGLGPQGFEEETGSSDEWLSRYPGYAGLAIHFYGSYRELLEGK